jgi:hypothetical protein
VPEIAYPAISEPTPDINALFKTVQQLKEAVELITGQRGEKFSFANQAKTIQRQFGNATAKLTQSFQVQADALGALASDVIDVTATANGISANGELKFEAKAAPTGASSSFGLYLTTGALFAGFEVIVDSVTGQAAINWTAQKLRFSDSGTSEPVFDYDSTDGVFRFFVPVELLTQDIGLNQVSHVVAARSAIGVKIRDASITVRDGASVLVSGDYTGATYSQTVGMAFGTLYITNGLGGAGSTLQQAQNNWVRDGGGQFWLGSSQIVAPLVGPLTAGTYDFSIVSTDNYTNGVSGGTVGLVLTELAR